MGRKVYSDTDASEEQGSTAQEENTAVPAPHLDGGSLGVPEGAVSVNGVTTEPSDKVFEPVTAERFTVVQDARINGTGGISWLKAGQTVDANNYDIEGIKRQGVKLVPFVASDPEA